MLLSALQVLSERWLKELLKEDSEKHGIVDIFSVLNVI